MNTLELMGEFEIFLVEFMNSLANFWLTIIGTSLGQIILYTTLILIIVNIFTKIIKESVKE